MLTDTINIRIVTYVNAIVCCFALSFFLAKPLYSRIKTTNWSFWHFITDCTPFYFHASTRILHLFAQWTGFFTPINSCIFRVHSLSDASIFTFFFVFCCNFNFVSPCTRQKQLLLLILRISRWKFCRSVAGAQHQIQLQMTALWRKLITTSVCCALEATQKWGTEFLITYLKAPCYVE